MGTEPVSPMTPALSDYSDKPLMTFAALAAALPNALLLYPPGSTEESNFPERAGFSSVCLDSRKCRAGSLFVCLEGETADGHAFAEAAFKAGASAALVRKAKLDADVFALKTFPEKYGAVLFAVDDTLAALQDAARAYLAQFPRLLKIGVTGSSGKTTVKEIAASIFAHEKGADKVIVNKGNLNSETGLPLSVFEVRAEHEAGVFEMGMNRQGEIAELARVLNPHSALITNIGAAHIGMLGSLENIAAEKKAAFSQFTGAETALIPDEDPFRDFLAQGVNGNVVFYPTDCPSRDLGLFGAEMRLENGAAAVRLPLPGAHNIKNALAAAAICRAAGCGFESVKEGIESVKPLFGRGEILRSRVTVIQDCYNANPDSSAAAIALCDSAAWTGRRVYVIGAMLELGAFSDEAHARIGRLLASSRADFVFLFGAETSPAADILKTSSHIPFFFTQNMQELQNEALRVIQVGDLVLLKGSRGCALERLTDGLLNI